MVLMGEKYRVKRIVSGSLSWKKGQGGKLYQWQFYIYEK